MDFGEEWILLLVGVIILLFIVLSTTLSKLAQSLDYLSENEKKNIKIWCTYVPILLVAVGVIYYVIDVNGWSSHALTWLNLLIRWTHVIIGIAWIGASFYFIFLENSLNRTKNLREGLAGNLWAIHGGGFYYVEKYKVAPEKLPEKLHWFKYEAYYTWLTGVLLLIVVYYSNASLYLIDTEVFDLSPIAAIAIGVGAIISGWVFYDLLSKSSLSKKPLIFAAVGFLFIVAMAYVLTHLFSGRAAYIHIGAMLGTMMAGNVFFVIIPSQKALVHAAETGGFVNPELGKNAGWRSLHNNYMTLPVIFIMVSNHYPTTFGHSHSWLILSGLIITSALFRHYLNLKEKGITQLWILPIVAIGVATLFYATSPPAQDESNDLPPVAFEEVYGIIQTRCQSCHASNPTDDFWTVAPNGLILESPEKIQATAPQIMDRVVIAKNMPLGNKTGITEEERLKIKAWILQGAKLE